MLIHDAKKAMQLLRGLQRGDPVYVKFFENEEPGVVVWVSNGGITVRLEGGRHAGTIIYPKSSVYYREDTP